MASRRLVQILGLLSFAAGALATLYVAYTYLEPDVSYAMQQPEALAAGEVRVVPLTGNIPPTLLPAPALPTSTPLHLPLPRGQGQPAVRLIIPRMKLEVWIKEARWNKTGQNGTLYSDWMIPFNAAGHLITTARPGEAGNVVLSGHHNLIAPNRFGVGLFAGLWNLAPGDSIFVNDLAGRVFRYQVTKSYYLRELGLPLSVQQQHAREVLADHGQPVMTLITCWNGQAAPLSGNTYRWIVNANLIGQIRASEIPTPTQ